MKISIFISLFTISLLAYNVSCTPSYNILAVFAFPGKSHFSMTNTLIKELIERGHKITMITAFTLAPLKLGSNYTEILIEPVYDFWNDVTAIFKADNLFDFTSMDMFGFLTMLEVLGLKTTEHALKQPKVQAIINANQTDGVFDLLLAEQFYQDAFLALSYKYKIPVITTSTLGYTNHMSQMVGIITPWSFVPHGFMPYTDNMNFWERLQNSFYNLYEDYFREFRYLPQQDQLVEKYFSHLQIDIPKVTQMEKKVSAILLNSFHPLTTARPTSENLITVGGMHIYPPKPLPTDIKQFLDGAEHGVIYFSLGSNVQSKDMPKDKQKIFFDVFARLKQRVLWKFEDESITNVPKNVMIKKWLPQSDVLAHPNIKVFITHGGLFGTQEGVHYAVPMLGMPVYCDQHLNINKAVLGGYAISMHFQSITHEMLENALHELLTNSSYKQNVQTVSNIFRDRPLNARETAIYWVEYVIRHKGAPHLRLAGADLKWYQFYLLDVISFVVGMAVLVLIVLVYLVRKLLTKTRGTKLKTN